MWTAAALILALAAAAMAARDQPRGSRPGGGRGSKPIGSAPELRPGPGGPQ
jgi:hypothetical protein